MPGQFINSGNTPGGNISLVNNSNSGNISISTPATVFSFAGKWSFMDRNETCVGFNSATYYSTTPLASVTNGTQIYTNIALTTTPAQPFISINSISYVNSGGLLSLGEPC